MSSYDDAFKQMQRQFIDKLPERFAKLHADYALLTETGWQPDIARQFHHQLHSLTGSVGTFGMLSLCAAVRQLANRVKEMNDKAAVPDKTQLLAIGTELLRLELLAGSWQDTAAPSIRVPTLVSKATTQPLIYIVEDDAAQASQVATELKENGFKVQVFNTIADFRIGWQQQPKADALVLDMIFPESDNAGVELLQELNVPGGVCPPVVMTSVRDDLPARLSAYRAGARRYLTKPLTDKKLSDILDDLTGRLPETPYRVMLVDDDPLLLQAQSAVLQQAGLLVQALTEPAKTLQLLDSFNPDVLVLDVYMPDIRGPELAAIVREQDTYLHLPILFLSAETDISQQLLALNLGGDDFLIKPVQPAHLVSAIVARARRARQNKSLSLRLQHTLYEREREHQALNLHAIVSVADITGRITYVNDLFCQISCYQREELLGKNHRIIKSNHHTAQFYQDLWRVISSGQVWHGEICNHRKDGDFYWVKSTITPMIGDDGKPYQYISVRTDITGQKKAEQAERKRNLFQTVLAQAAEQLLAADSMQIDNAITQALALFAEYLNTARGYLFLFSPDGMHLSNSHEWCAFGVAARQPDMQNLSINIWPWWIQQIQQGEAVLVSDTKALPVEADAEKEMFTSLGIQALCGFPLRWRGKSIGFIGFEQLNMPRQWQQEDLKPVLILAELINSALLRSESERAKIRSVAELNATLESIKDGILAVDHHGKVLFMNRQFRDMWRLPPGLLKDVSDERLLELALTQLVDPKDFMLKVRALYRSGEESQDLIELKDGRVFDRYSKPLFGYDQNKNRVWSFHDITERRQAEEAADAAKDRLRRGQLYANIGTWEWNIANGGLSWTERIAPLFGYPKGDLATTYDNFLAAVHPDDRQSVIDAVSACVECDAPYDIEHRVVWPDGTVRWLLERGAVRRDAKGKALLMTGVVQDITDRKFAEIALAEREQQLLQAQKLAKLGNWQQEFATQQLVWSAEVFRIFGYEPHSIKPTLAIVQQAVHPEDLKLFLNKEMQAQISGLHDLTYRIILPDGSIRYVHELANMVLDEHAKPLRLVGTLQDLTERIEAEQKLNDSEQRFIFAVEGAGDGVWDWQVNTGEVSLSACYESMLGYQINEILHDIDHAWLALIHPDDLAYTQNYMAEYLAGGLTEYTLEFRMRCKDGEYIWVLSRGTVVERDTNNRPSRIIGIHSDISKRKQLNLELISARELAEQANRAKSEFLSSMSHELRTPMNAILGFGQLMEYDDSLPYEHKDNVHEILKAGSHLLDLINEVLDLAKVESGSVNLSIEPVALCPVVQECKTLIAAMAQRRDITLHLTCADDIMVRADRTRLKQVLLNLLSNAIKYNCEAGKVELELQHVGQNYLRILIKDTGPGIMADKLQGIFQPFNRLGAENSNVEGTGIGLTITQRIVEIMAGRIGVDSEPGVGSRFWIELPLAQEFTRGEAAKINELEKDSRDCCDEVCQDVAHHVLYIEDNPVNIKLVSQLLAMVPHLTLMTAHTPSLGLELAYSSKLDLILLDINMPGLDGYQVLEALRAQPRLQNIPVIAITANAMPRDIERGKLAGFAEYITKPIHIERFLALVQQYLQGPS